MSNDNDIGFTLFDTSFGRCGIAWGKRGILAIQLPEEDDASTARRLLGRRGEIPERSPPRRIEDAVRRITSHLAGRMEDLSKLPLDMDGLPPFHRRVYDEARRLGAGSTATYGELAVRVGSPGAARAVGQAMARNPFVLAVPCHRVLGSDGRATGFSARGGCSTKEKLLLLEGRRLAGGDARAGVAAPPARAAGSLFAGASGLQFDPLEATGKLRSVDAALGQLMDVVGPFGLKPQALRTPFEALAEAIIHQQLNGKAAASILGRVRAAAGRGRFPRPRALLDAPDALLRSAGLSRAKVASLRDLAARALEGTLPSLARLRKMDDEAIVGDLDAIRGVGRWTVEMLLIFRLGRPDVLPVIDYGIRKGFEHAFRTRGLPSPEAVLRRGERWRPFRTVASWYLWRAADMTSAP